MPEFELPLPLGGVSDDLAYSKQDLATTREAFNARSQDPSNWRERPAQRAGMSKANETAISAGVRVAELISTVFDARGVTYSLTDQDEIAEFQEWFTATPSKENPLHIVTDSQGNLYSTDGDAGICKLNPDGQLLWQFPLPVQDKNQSIRFVFVDDLFDIYTGVSDGTVQKNGRLWKLTQLPDNKVEITWEVALNAYVETALVKQDKLYTAQNQPDTRTAYIRVYGSLDATVPKLLQEFRAPWPIHDIDVKEDGSIFVASANAPSLFGTDAHRRNPKFPALFPEAVDWTPFDLTDWEKRIWSWYVADAIGEFDVSGDYVDGAPILRVPDISGHERHLYPCSITGMNPPTLAFEALGTRKGIRFNGLDQALESLPNLSAEFEYADQQKTALPAYKGSMFFTLMLVRLQKRTTGNPMYVFGQDNQGTGATDHILLANRDSGAVISANFLSGNITHYAATDATGDGGGGTAGHPRAGNFLNDNSLALVAILWDGGIEPNHVNDGTDRSLYRTNGDPRDRYEGLENWTTDKTIIGFWTNPGSGAGVDNLQGDLIEWITLDMKDRTDTTTDPKILSHDALESTSTPVAQTDNECTRLEGYMAHRAGGQGVLKRATFPHPYACQNTGSNRAGPPPDGRDGPYGRMQVRYPVLVKFSPIGKALWAINLNDTDPLDGGTKMAGVGYGVKVSKDGNVYSFGPTSDPVEGGLSNLSLRKIIDQGDDFSLASADGAWAVDIGDPTYGYPRMVVDKFDNLYVPVFSTTDALRVFKGSDGTQLAGVEIGVPAREARAVAIDPNIPDYGDDLTNELARFVYVAATAGTDPETGLYKIRLVDETPTAGSPRTLVNLGIAGNGTIKTFELDGAMATPSGASGALSSAANYIQAATAFEKIIISDGLTLQVYDPRTDAVSKLTATKGGEPPHGAKLIEYWAGRVVACRAPQLIHGAYGWLMSRKGGPITDWDAFPPDRDSAAAIGSTNISGPGQCPDLINAFIPYNDDIAFFGCDHSLYMMTGDPGDGGQFDLVSDITGVAFGRAWCKDPDGGVWFMGSRGGLYYMPPGARPTRVSKNIDRRLSEIDFGTSYVRLCWNDDDQGIHIHRYAFGTPGDPVEHWFWDARRGGAWPDTYGTASEPDVEPTAIYAFDGDGPEDRVVLVGCQDGFIRRLDADARDDDGTAIDWNLLIGPLARSDVHREMRFVGPRVVLASEQDGCIYQLYATDDPAVLGAVRHTGELGAGRNGYKRSRMRGSYCFVRLRNSLAGQRCAVEEAAIMAYPSGLKRVRESL